VTDRLHHRYGLQLQVTDRLHHRYGRSSSRLRIAYTSGYDRLAVPRVTHHQVTSPQLQVTDRPLHTRLLNVLQLQVHRASQPPGDGRLHHQGATEGPGPAQVTDRPHTTRLRSVLQLQVTDRHTTRFMSVLQLQVTDRLHHQVTSSAPGTDRLHHQVTSVLHQ
jgi:hypothetical protein